MEKERSKPDVEASFAHRQDTGKISIRELVSLSYAGEEQQIDRKHEPKDMMSIPLPPLDVKRTA